jgi:predicted component of type VI protein secretion system
MIQNNGKGFHQLELDAKVTLVGQLLLTTGTAFLSLGQIFKLVRSNQLPTVPINQPVSTTLHERSANLYSPKKNYFES